MIVEYVIKVMQEKGFCVRGLEQKYLGICTQTKDTDQIEIARADAVFRKSLLDFKLRYPNKWRSKINEILNIDLNPNFENHNVSQESIVDDSSQVSLIPNSHKRTYDITHDTDFTPRHPVCNLAFSKKYTPDLSGRKPGSPPVWLNRDALRDAMFKRVNNIANGRWEAVSMPDGIVWFRYAALLDVLREASNRDPYVLALAVDTVKMNDLVYTVLMSFKDDCFIWFMPKKGYLGCKCTVTDNRGNATETYLTPVKASWFNQLPSTFERQKTYKLLQAVAKVELAYGAKI